MNCKDCVNYRYCDDENKNCGICEAFTKRDKRPIRPMSPYERTKAAVYATGNKWAIENFHATHD